MKKVNIPAQREEAQYFCDKHPDRECYNQVNTKCWYGSEFDMLNLEMHLCDECMLKFYAWVKETFGVEPQDDWERL